MSENTRRRKYLFYEIILSAICILLFSCLYQHCIFCQSAYFINRYPSLSSACNATGVVHGPVSQCQPCFSRQKCILLSLLHILFPERIWENAVAGCPWPPQNNACLDARDINPAAQLITMAPEKLCHMPLAAGTRYPCRQRYKIHGMNKTKWKTFPRERYGNVWKRTRNI